ncbi:MAG: integration host factor subunit alpha [Deltaproteobacteria bacterium]|jgi:integration host factor subunit alpha|nr:integration host factor subunit alpha [Deltaproteobacteria bacterium]
MTVTKERIVSRILEETTVNPLQARRHVESILDIIKSTLANENHVLISGFGKFMVRKKRSRQGRNPQTGQPMNLKARQVVTFKISGVLRKRISPVKT